MNRVVSFLYGLLLGGLIGGAVGLLFAPSRGDEFRQRVTSYADQVAADVRMSVAQKQAELERELEIRRNPELSG
jgi:gas vesicle protein